MQGFLHGRVPHKPLDGAQYIGAVESSFMQQMFKVLTHAALLDALFKEKDMLGALGGLDRPG